MGTVYLARDSRLDRDVALKVCLLSGEQALERFRREAKAAAALRHPHLCPVYEADVRDSIPYLVMAFISGPTLAERLNEHGPLPPREAAILVQKLALALHDAHGRGIVHRDLKPSNIALDERGEPVVLDFGLALAGADQRLTQTGAKVGTPAYMAPEQISGQTRMIGPGTDIYALGVVLYELVTGQLPFVGPLGAVYGQILHAVPEAPSTLRPGLGEELDRICLKALEKKIEERFKSMAHLAEALGQSLLRGLEAQASGTFDAPSLDLPPPVPNTSIVADTAVEHERSPPRDGPGDATVRELSGAAPPTGVYRTGLMAAGAAAGIFLLVGILLAVLLSTTPLGLVRQREGRCVQ
jgi:serine/threonine protein kinase